MGVDYKGCAYQMLIKLKIVYSLDETEWNQGFEASIP